jgi:hypothetical protein
MGTLLYTSKSHAKSYYFYNAVTKQTLCYSYCQKDAVLIFTVNSNRLHKCMLKIPFSHLQKLYVKFF